MMTRKTPANRKVKVTENRTTGRWISLTEKLLKWDRYVVKVKI